MKLIPVYILFAAMAMTGCTSAVKTYDGANNQLGACTAYRGLGVTGGGAHCSGSANPKDQR